VELQAAVTDAEGAPFAVQTIEADELRPDHPRRSRRRAHPVEQIKPAHDAEAGRVIKAVVPM
jgi:hypothetical protein